MVGPDETVFFAVKHGRDQVNEPNAQKVFRNHFDELRRQGEKPGGSKLYFREPNLVGTVVKRLEEMQIVGSMEEGELTEEDLGRERDEKREKISPSDRQ